MERAIPLRPSRGWAVQEAIVVIVNARIVSVVMETELSRVALAEKVLDVQIGNVNLLSAFVKCVQSAIRILFEKIKPRDVVRQPIGAQIPKDTNARLLF